MKKLLILFIIILATGIAFGGTCINKKLFYIGGDHVEVFYGESVVTTGIDYDGTWAVYETVWGSLYETNWL